MKSLDPADTPNRHMESQIYRQKTNKKMAFSFRGSWGPNQ